MRYNEFGIKRAKRYSTFMATDVDGAASVRDSMQQLALDNDEIKLTASSLPSTLRRSEVTAPAHH